jgi:hypothetical protein
MAKMGVTMGVTSFTSVENAFILLFFPVRAIAIRKGRKAHTLTITWKLLTKNTVSRKMENSNTLVKTQKLSQHLRPKILNSYLEGHAFSPTALSL